MFNKLTTFIKCERGVAATEFALLVPVFVVITLGIVDYGRFINERMKLQELSRTAVQYVVQGGSDSDVVANIIQTSDFYERAVADGQTINVETSQECECADGASISCNTSSTCSASGDYKRYFYTATLESTYDTIFVYPGIPDSVSLTGYTRMQYNP
jgi:Flp pilus assembly protein TadG